MSYKAMTLTELSAKYKVCTRTFKKWIIEFSPEIKRANGTYAYTPLQVKQIVEKLGEW